LSFSASSRGDLPNASNSLLANPPPPKRYGASVNFEPGGNLLVFFAPGKNDP
jgi:hypothetical protein